MCAKKRTRLRRICFTINTPNDSDHIGLVDLYQSSIFRFLIYQTERGDTTGREHIQGYAELVSQLEFSTLKGIMPEGAHIEAARGSSRDNIRYCSKSDTRISGPFVYGEAAPGQGDRTDLHVCVELLGKSASLEECVSDVGFRSCYVKYSTGFERLARLLRKPIQTPQPPEEKEVIVLWGKTGTGKSHTAYSDLLSRFDQQEPYSLCDLSGAWFDGYAGQRGAILDDFRGKGSGMRVEQFLRITDKWPLAVPVKGGFVRWTPQVIYITSNTDPEEWYNEEPVATQEAVSRRLKTVKFLS